MNDDEFRKKLETILDNLYKIDREVRNYLDMNRVRRETQDYKKPLETNTDGEYKS